MDELYEMFRDPSSLYRGKPFWAWNGKLEPEELRRQIRVFHTMGLGGGFMHSRVGLDTEYLGDDWFECVRACVDECKKLEMEAWLYDEDRWPSGAAGGLVTKNPRFRMRSLVMTVLPPKKWAGGKGLIGAWEGKVEQDCVCGLRPIPKNGKPSGEKGTSVLTFHVQVQPSSSWYNDYTYLDTMSDDAVQKFIDVTYEAYRKEIGKDFGPLVPGVFTDEPNYGHCGSTHVDSETGVTTVSMPWTQKLPTVFEERYGYDIRKHLPEVFLNVDGEEVNQARYHFHDCTTHLFADNFGGMIGKWCGKNKLLFTGHLLAEQTLQSQVSVVGSTLRFYEHMQAPGIDILTQARPEYDTAKQCASALNQMGRRWMLSELYGCTGWDFTFEGHKYVGDWQAALGVNLRCQHLSWYTMKGQAKRDYPASIFFQSPWWEHYRVVEDYFARVNTLLSEGVVVRPLLVIHPVESMWLRCRAHWQSQADVQELDQMMVDVRDWLLQEHLDFDYGDEEMLSRLGAVEEFEGYPLLRLGEADYEAVLVPPQATIRSSTLKLLEEFQAAGGLVVFAGKAPAYVDAVRSSAAAKAAAKCEKTRFSRKAVVEALDARVRVVSIADAKGKEIPSVLYMLRLTEDEAFLFLCNTDRERGHDPVNVSVAWGTSVEEWDASTGERYGVPAEPCGCEDDGCGCGGAFVTSLPPTGSRLFVLREGPASALAPRPELRETRKARMAAPVGVQLGEPNVLVLDRPAFQIGDGAVQEPEEILRVDQRVRAALGVPGRGGQMVQPWARKKSKAEPSVPVTLRYCFTVEELPRTASHLILETPDRFQIRVNQTELAYDEAGAGWWADPCLKRIPLDPAVLIPGENEIELGIDYTPSDELEAIFLAGDFGVAVEGTKCTVTKAVQKLKLGDWVGQGLPFYGGAVGYLFTAEIRVRKGERVFVEVPGFKGTAIRVLVNDAEAGHLPWPPYEVEITDLVKRGENRIGLELFGSRRNCFGPLHHTNPDPPWTGPGEYVTSGDGWQDDYHLKPCGLLKAPTLSFRK